jgi:small-conductance mechanosensitive channel/CRP-like cAMP-binding protein
MEKQQVKVLVVGLLSIAVLVFLYFLSDDISPQNNGTDFDYEKLVRALIVTLIAIASIRIIFLAFVRPIEQKLQKQVPNIIKDIIGALVLIVAAIFIITNIYAQSALVLFIGLGTSGIGILYIAQDLLKELMAGIVIAFQNNYKIGNWIKLPNGTVGQIVKSNLTGMDLLLVDQTILHITNRMVTDQAVINLSQPQTPFFTETTVLLEHDVPVERARRILLTATINAAGVVDKDVTVVAESVQMNGVSFSVYFKVPSYGELISVRHNVISSIIAHLHKHNLRVCEISGQYNIINVDKNIKKQFYDSYVTDEFSTLQFSGLLKNCAPEVQKQFAKNMKKLMFKAGEKICEQDKSGDTMYIIAEGVINVIVNVSATEKSGKTKTSTEIVTTLSDGDYFGEMALLCGEKRNATIIAKTDVVIYEIKRKTVKSFVEKYQDFAEKLSEAIIERNLKNESIKNRAIAKLNKKDNAISELMVAFKLFLGGG